MSCKTAVALLMTGFVLFAAPCLAQDEDAVKNFKLLRDSDTAARELDLESEDEIKWERGLDGRDIDLSFGLGFMDLGSTLLQHDQIIYKYSTEFTYWGDVELTGESAFAPILRLGYTVNRWLAIEGLGSLSFSEYSASITNARARKNEPGAQVIDDVTLGEYDAEHRSLITILAGANAMIYPLNLVRDEGKGWMQPYVTGGYGRMWYDMNSQYSGGMVSTNSYNVGVGFRVLGDERISIRLEALYHMNTVEFDPPEYFDVLDEGTTQILLEEHPIIDGQRVDRVVEEYESQDINSLHWSLGIQGSF